MGDCIVIIIFDTPKKSRANINEAVHHCMILHITFSISIEYCFFLVSHGASFSHFLCLWSPRNISILNYGLLFASRVLCVCLYRSLKGVAAEWPLGLACEKYGSLKPVSHPSALRINKQSV